VFRAVYSPLHAWMINLHMKIMKAAAEIFSLSHSCSIAGFTFLSVLSQLLPRARSALITAKVTFSSDYLVPPIFDGCIIKCHHRVCRNPNAQLHNVEVLKRLWLTASIIVISIQSVGSPLMPCWFRHYHSGRDQFKQERSGTWCEGDCTWWS